MSTKAWVVTCLATGVLGFGIGVTQRGEEPAAVVSTPPPAPRVAIVPTAPAKEPVPKAQVKASPPVEAPQPTAVTAETAADRRERGRKEMIEARQQEFLAKMDGERFVTYDALLTGLGMNGEQIKEVSQKLRGLHEQAMVAGEPMGALALQRAEYDRHMREVLGEDGYRIYREFEDSKPYRREVAKIVELAQGKETAIEPARQQELVSLLSRFDIKIDESWDGPYDPLPSPLAGAEPIAKKVGAQARSLKEGLRAMEQDPAWHALPEEVAAVASEYLRNRTTALDKQGQDLLRRSRLTPEERREQMTQEIMETRAKLQLERDQRAAQGSRSP